MRCEDVKENLSAYIDNELEKAELSAIGGHINQCNGCGKEEKELRALVSAVGTMPRYTAPVHIARAVEDEVNRMEKMEKRSLDISKHRFILPVAIAAAAGVILVVNIDLGFKPFKHIISIESVTTDDGIIRKRGEIEERSAMEAKSLPSASKLSGESASKPDDIASKGGYGSSKLEEQKNKVADNEQRLAKNNASAPQTATTIAPAIKQNIQQTQIFNIYSVEPEKDISKIESIVKKTGLANFGYNVQRQQAPSMDALAVKDSKKLDEPSIRKQAEGYEITLSCTEAELPTLASELNVIALSNSQKQNDALMAKRGRAAGGEEYNKGKVLEGGAGGVAKGADSGAKQGKMDEPKDELKEVEKDNDPSKEAEQGKREDLAKGKESAGEAEKNKPAVEKLELAGKSIASKKADDKPASQDYERNEGFGQERDYLKKGQAEAVGRALQQSPDSQQGRIPVIIYLNKMPEAEPPAAGIKSK